MAVGLLNYTVADLCLGKPPLRRISAATATVADALEALKSSSSGDPFISLWACDCFDINGQESVKDHHHHHSNCRESICVGRVCIVDIICYLCNGVNSSSSLRPSSALQAPVTVLLCNENKGLVKHVEPSSSLLEAMDLILKGAQHLIVPIKNRHHATSNPKRKHLTKSSAIIQNNKQEYCWLAQDDVIRFLLSSIGLFSPLPTLSIETLNIIDREFPVLHHISPATSSIESIARSTVDQNSIAIIDDHGALVGEISPFTLTCRGESAVAAIMTLSAGDLMGYIECGGPPEDLVRVVEERLKEKKLSGLLEEFKFGSCDDVDSCMSLSLSSSSSDEESPPLTSRKGRRVRRSSGGGYSSSRVARMAESIVCHRWSSLVAVMVQAIAHRVNYVWVVEEDCTVVGVVNFASILRVFRDGLEAMM